MILQHRKTWVNIGLGNGLLPDGAKPLPEPMLTYYRGDLVALTGNAWYEFRNFWFKNTATYPRGQWVNRDQLIETLTRHMATQIWGNIGSGNGLLPDGTKPLSEPRLTDHHWSPMTFTRDASPINAKICLKITCLKFHSNFPGANKLIWCQCSMFQNDKWLSHVLYACTVHNTVHKCSCAIYTSWVWW